MSADSDRSFDLTPALSTQPTLSVYTSGKALFSVGAFAETSGEDTCYTHVEVYINDSARQLGFVPREDPDDADAENVCPLSGKGGRIVHLNGILRDLYGADASLLDEIVYAPLEYDSETGLYICDLDPVDDAFHATHPNDDREVEGDGGE